MKRPSFRFVFTLIKQPDMRSLIFMPVFSKIRYRLNLPTGYGATEGGNISLYLLSNLKV